MIVPTDLAACGGQAAPGAVCVPGGPGGDLPAVSTTVGGRLENSAARRAHAPRDERERVCFCAQFTRGSTQKMEPRFLRTDGGCSHGGGSASSRVAVTVRGTEPLLACPCQPQVGSVQARFLV